MDDVLEEDSVCAIFAQTASDDLLLSMYLDYAEIQAENSIPMTMEDWANRLDSFIEFNGRDLLMNAGKISAEKAKLHAETQFEKYRIVQDQLFKRDFDLFLESTDE
nr:RhuM family protein [Sedimentibacter hydroxybenzoicus]